MSLISLCCFVNLSFLPSLPPSIPSFLPSFHPTNFLSTEDAIYTVVNRAAPPPPHHGVCWVISSAGGTVRGYFSKSGWGQHPCEDIPGKAYLSKNWKEAERAVSISAAEEPGQRREPVQRRWAVGRCSEFLRSCGPVGLGQRCRGV